MDANWISPDGRIKKIIISEGDWGKKPFESSECRIKITNNGLEKLDFYTIGGGSDDFSRQLDICLQTMNEKEKSTFTLIKENDTFTIELLQLNFKGLIYEWDAKRKLSLVMNHKNKGVQLFQSNENREAAYKFAKALKILFSIPINQQDAPEKIDGVLVWDINQLKATLFNNLASCYLRSSNWMRVIELCRKVFDFDEDNVKARYKMGVAFMNDKNFEEAKNAFEFVLKRDPHNKIVVDHLRTVKDELKKAQVRVNLMVKKMFV